MDLAKEYVGCTSVSSNLKLGCFVRCVYHISILTLTKVTHVEETLNYVGSPIYTPENQHETGKSPN